MSNGKVGITRRGRPRAIWRWRSSDRGSFETVEASPREGPGAPSIDVGALQFVVDDRLYFEVETDVVAGAKTSLCRAMAEQARGLGVANFDRLLADLSGNLAWTDDQIRALAMAFVFGSPFAFRRIAIDHPSTGRRGRPLRVDEQTLRLTQLANAWRRVTKRVPGATQSALFVAALCAVAPHLGFSGRNCHSVNAVAKWVRRERDKILSPGVVWQMRTVACVKPALHDVPFPLLVDVASGVVDVGISGRLCFERL